MNPEEKVAAIAAWDALLRKHGNGVVTLEAFSEVMLPLFSSLAGTYRFVRDMNAKNIERNARLDALEKTNTVLAARIVALEARPAIQDRGVWVSAATYNPGDIVSHGGSAWICRATHIAGPDISHDSFRLLVKHGRDLR